MEELLVINTDLQIIAVLDTYESLLWVERYNKIGEFEIYTKTTTELLEQLTIDNYLYSSESTYLMIIESVELKTDKELGSTMLVKGRTFESVLNRRIIWSQTTLSGNLQNGIKKLIDENAISPTDPNRAIPNLFFELTDDITITDLNINAQFTRDNLYESIEKICIANNIGFMIVYDPVFYTFTFTLYNGIDRSYNQLPNPYVVFSPEFDNIINSEYKQDNTKLKTLSVVAGEGEGTDRITEIVGSGTGLGRRETYTDAKDLSQTVDNVLITEEEYRAQLAQRGLEDLSENIIENTFDSKVDSTKTFKYGTDFFLGDIVQIENEYGIRARARVTEVVISKSTNGSEILPTFTIIE